MRDHQLLVLAFIAAGIALVVWSIRGERHPDRRRWAASTSVDPEPAAPPLDPVAAAEVAELYAMCPDITRVVEFPRQTRRPGKDQP